jgi:16S rRNA processing protein RimM
MPNTPVPTPTDRVELAAITGAHGIAGEVRLKLLGEGFDALTQHSSFNEGAITLQKVRSDNKGGAIARLAQSSNRNEAERLRGTVLTVPRQTLPALADGEYYHADLIGLDAVTDTGTHLGIVIAVENFGASDIVEIERMPVPEKGMKTFMVPMIDQAVLEWDDKRVVIAKDFAEE